MFEIGFSELLLVMVIGLVVLGPERLPGAIKAVAGWIRALRSLASSVQHELSQELKLQELQESLKKVEQQASLKNISPELRASMDELKEAAESMKRPYRVDDVVSSGKQEEGSNTIHSPVSLDPEAMHDADMERLTAPVRPEPVQQVGLPDPAAEPDALPHQPNSDR